MKKLSYNYLMDQKINNYKKIIDGLDLTSKEKEIVRTNWSDNVYLMDFLARRHFIRFNVLNLTTIVGGILIPVSVLLIPVYNNHDFGKIVATIIGVLVSISSSINQSYKFNDRWKHFRRISENLKIEGENFLILSGSYSNFVEHNGEALKQFMGNISLIKMNQINDYIKKVSNSKETQNLDVLGPSPR